MNTVTLEGLQKLSSMAPGANAPASAGRGNTSTNGHEAYGKAALEGELAKLRAALVGERNNTLNESAFALGQLIGGGELSELEVTNELERASVEIGLEPAEATSTIQSGLTAGMRQPRTVPEPSLRRNRGAESIIPNSQSLKSWELGKSQNGREQGAGVVRVLDAMAQKPTATRKAIQVWKEKEPEPRPFAIEGLVPDGVVTTLYGDGGQGKSYLALYLAILSCLGLPFAGRKVEKRAALYIDGELDAAEFVRRAYSVARGLGLECPPAGLHYYQLEGPLSNSVVQERVKFEVETCEATFVVLDSLTMSTYGADPKDAQDMVGVIKYLETLGPVVAIDHIPGATPGANLSQYREFGSVFKGNGARSRIQVIKADGGGQTLIHKKTNFGPLSKSINLAMTFTSNEASMPVVRFENIEANDPRMAGIENHLPAKDRVYRELSGRSLEETGGAKPEELAGPLDMAVHTVRNYLTVLKKDGYANSKNGVWWAMLDGGQLPIPNFPIPNS